MGTIVLHFIHHFKKLLMKHRGQRWNQLTLPFMTLSEPGWEHNVRLAVWPSEKTKNRKEQTNSFSQWPCTVFSLQSFFLPLCKPQTVCLAGQIPDPSTYNTEQTWNIKKAIAEYGFCTSTLPTAVPNSAPTPPSMRTLREAPRIEFWEHWLFQYLFTFFSWDTHFPTGDMWRQDMNEEWEPNSCTLCVLQESTQVIQSGIYY